MSTSRGFKRSYGDIYCTPQSFTDSSESDCFIEDDHFATVSRPRESIEHRPREYCNSCDHLQSTVERLTYKIETLIEKVNKMNKRLKSLDTSQALQVAVTEDVPIVTSKKEVKGFGVASKMVEKIRRLRSNPEWANKVKKFRVNGVPEDKMKEIRSVILHGSELPSFVAIKIAKILWEPEYLKQHMVGPKTREPRPGERTDFMPEKEESKLKEILRIISPSFTDKPEWKCLVKDPINQASRDMKCRSDRSRCLQYDTLDEHHLIISQSPSLITETDEFYQNLYDSPHARSDRRLKLVNETISSEPYEDRIPGNDEEIEHKYIVFPQ